jgi:hypothetical protein
LDDLKDLIMRTNECPVLCSGIPIY